MGGQTSHSEWSSLALESINFLVLRFSSLWPIIQLACKWVFIMSVTTLINGHGAQDKDWSIFIYEPTRFEFMQPKMLHYLHQEYLLQANTKTLPEIHRTSLPPSIKRSIGAFRCLTLTSILWNAAVPPVSGPAWDCYGNAIEVKGRKEPERKRNSSSEVRPLCQHKGFVLEKQMNSGSS